MNRSAFKQAFLDTAPVMTGYLFLGTGFGVGTLVYMLLTQLVF